MASGPNVVYNDAKLAAWKKLVDLSSDSLAIALFTSASIAINDQVTPATYTALAADGHEVASGNGYTTGGVAVPSVTLAGGGSVGTIALGVGNVAWSVTGAGFTARVAVLYDTTSPTKVAIAYMLLDATPADVTALAGQSLTVSMGNVFNETGN